ncbi:MAG: sugar ABC transporter permease [Candidatus Cohnella colombiensis]|uniref:Sugar ABC transporter permease n=1 Tax=Candidatus Cohnella colombiensis TaxID=3121368 RepID=A0AA95JFY8_9BACL|nr:MAG: sugar ABC transporter permease [Cohnella sp.]
MSRAGIDNTNIPQQTALIGRPAPTRFQLWWQEVKKNKHSYVLMSPYMLLFFLFTVLPVCIAIVISFTYFNLLEFPKWVGWHNYSRMFLEDEIFLTAIKNTFIFAGITGPISYAMCFVFAWLVNELKPKMRAFMTLAFYAPSISGNVFFIWLIIFSGDRYGFMNGFLLELGFINEPIQFLRDEHYVLWIVLIVQLWLSLGVSFLAFIAGLQTIDRTLFEAGAVDGIKNRWQELWFITLPSMRPQLLFGAVMQITASFAVADVSTQLAGFPSVNYAAHTVVTHLEDYGTIRFEMGYASAIATVLFLIMVTVNIVVQKLLRKVGE